MTLKTHLEDKFMTFQIYKVPHCDLHLSRSPVSHAPTFFSLNHVFIDIVYRRVTELRERNIARESAFVWCSGLPRGWYASRKALWLF